LLLKQLNLPSDFGLSFVVSFNLTLQALVKPDAIVEKNFSEALELSRNQSAKVFELGRQVIWPDCGKNRGKQMKRTNF